MSFFLSASTATTRLGRRWSLMEKALASKPLGIIHMVIKALPITTIFSIVNFIKDGAQQGRYQ